MKVPFRSESRKVRPYFNVPSEVARSLNEVGVKFSEKDTFTASESVQQSCSAYECDIYFQLPRNAVHALCTWPEIKDFFLGALLKDYSRRRAEPIMLAEVSSLPDDGILKCNVSDRCVDWSGPKGAVLSLYLFRAKQSKRRPGVPWRMGGIAAAKHFFVNKRGYGPEFGMTYASADEFVRNGFPATAVAAIFGGVEGLYVESREDVRLDMRVNDQLVPVLQHAKRSNACSAVQDAIKTMLVAQLLDSLKESSLLDESTVAHAVAARILKVANKNVRDLPSMSASELSAIAQAYCNLLASASTLLK